MINGNITIIGKAHDTSSDAIVNDASWTISWLMYHRKSGPISSIVPIANDGHQIQTCLNLLAIVGDFSRDYLEKWTIQKTKCSEYRNTGGLFGNISYFYK